MSAAKSNVQTIKPAFETPMEKFPKTRIWPDQWDLSEMTLQQIAVPAHKDDSGCQEKKGWIKTTDAWL